MTIVDRHTTTPEHVLRAARDLLPTIAARAPEIEAGRRIPSDLLDDLRRAGCFRMLLPTSHDGAGADLATAMRLFETIASADGSTAWIVMIGGGAWCDLTELPRASFDALFADRSDPIFAGVFNPSGTTTADRNGYRVSGRWSFASGCEHADWLFGNCVESVVDGVPQLRVAVFAPDQVEIEDTWSVSGLCGTGSHHFRVDDLVVPADRTFDPFAGEACLDEPLVRIPPPALISLVVASVAIGIAQGALDDITGLAVGKTPLLAREPLAANHLFQFELATADTELRAARALLYETAEAAWETATGTAQFELGQRARIRAAAVWATERAAAVVDAAYRSGGGSSIYTECPLQRRHRDVHAVTQHFLVKRDTLTTVGAVLAGQDVQLMVF